MPCYLNSKSAHLARSLKLLLGCAVIALPILPFWWSGAAEYRIILVFGCLIGVIALAAVVGFKKNYLVKLGVLDLWCLGLMAYCAANNLCQDHYYIIEPLFYVKWLSLVLVYFFCRNIGGDRGSLWICAALAASAFVQAVISILQYLGVIGVTLNGNFVNSAGFANTIPLSVYLAVGFICCLQLCLRLYKNGKYPLAVVTFSVCITIVAAFVLCLCRGTLVGLIVAVGVFILDNIRGKHNPKLKMYVGIAMVICLLIVVSGLYMLKVPSANTRFLLWRVSGDMIKENTLLGRGAPGFAADYMYYQAEYFRNNPESGFVKISNNHYQSYNIFVQMLVEHGVVGFVLLMGVIWTAFARCRKGVWRYVLLCLLAASCFTYTNHVFPLMLIFPMALGMLREEESGVVKAGFLIRIAVGVVGLFLIGYSVIALGRYERVCRVVEKGGFVGSKDFMELCRNNRNFNLQCSMNIFNSEELAAAEKLEMMEFLNEGMTTSEKICDMGDLYLAVGDVVKAEEHYLLAHYMVPCRVIPLGKLIALYEKVGDEEKLFDVSQKIIDTDYSVVSSVTLRIRARAKEIIGKFE